MTVKQVYLCGDCGMDFPKWAGKCPNCGAWETLKLAPGRFTAKQSIAAPDIISWQAVGDAEIKRQASGLPFLDKVLGGGWVRNSLVLLGGDPGVGKSTLALQIASYLKGSVLYVSGEETVEQSVGRLRRLLNDDNLKPQSLNFLADARVENILAALDKNRPDLLIVDSLQTLTCENVNGVAGSLAQVKAGASALAEAAKRLGTTILLIVQVTKAGELAGPKTVEHLVDAVMHLSGDRYQQYRLLKAVKNRFGSTDETAVLSMTNGGLKIVADPSKIFLASRTNHPGSAVFPAISGSLVFLAEVQSLASKTAAFNAKRSALGFDGKRLDLLAAILNKRAGIDFGRFDLYVNLAGGLLIKEPAVDLAVVASLISAFYDKPLPDKTAIFGEVGLSGEVRPVNKVKERLKEAARLGFKHLIMPDFSGTVTGLKITKIKDIGDLVNFLS